MRARDAGLVAEVLHHVDELRDILGVKDTMTDTTRATAFGFDGRRC